MYVYIYIYTHVCMYVCMYVCVLSLAKLSEDVFLDSPMETGPPDTNPISLVNWCFFHLVSLVSF